MFSIYENKGWDNVTFQHSSLAFWCTLSIAAQSWCPEFVHCIVVLHYRDAEETCFCPAWFCGCVAWVLIGFTIPVGIHRWSFSQKFCVKHAPCIPKDAERDFFPWWNNFEYLYTWRTWMTIFHGLPVFQVIMMNPRFISSCNILEEIIPFETMLFKRFLGSSFPVYLHWVSQLFQYPPGTNFSIV